MTDWSLNGMRACRIRQRGTPGLHVQGGATSVELELSAGWDESLTDDDLPREIQSTSS
ncbi:MAG TPA: hypothetical protein VLK84_25550 [Longimicrobium sp.]|nr:hypothetical protein [Longimicrobium sp.]